MPDLTASNFSPSAATSMQPDCGSRTGVRAHRRAGQPLCEDCKLVALLDEAIPTRPAPADPAGRPITTIQADTNWQELAGALGIDPKQIARDTVDRLVDTYRNGHHKAARRALQTMNASELRQLVIVLIRRAARTASDGCRPDDGVIDDVAIDRAIEGAPALLTDTERAIAVHRMHTAGLTPSRIAGRLHIAPRTVRRILDRPVPLQLDLPWEETA